MNSFIFISSILDEIVEQGLDIIGGIFNIVWSLLCSLIYGLIVIMFNIFNSITELDFLSTDKISGIYQRLTMIITIVMVFYITFAVVKYIVSPDTVTDKEKGAGAIVMRIVVSILLIAFVPTIFKIGYDLQGRILKTNIISKVIFGQEDWDYKTAGNNFAGDTFAAFYRVNASNCKSEADCKKAQAKVDSVISSWKKDQGLWALTKANASEIIDIDNTIQFDGLLAVIFGCFVVYVLFSYNLDMVTRYVQLIFLQLMAPVAIISYIAPQKDNMLKKWAKQCTTTYLDLFIRIAILYFMLLIMSTLSNSFDFYEMSKNGEQINIFMYIFIICGLLIFVQRAPKLIKELFPSTEGAASIGFGFNAKTRTEPIMKAVSATAGAIAGPTRALLKLGNDKGKFKLMLNKDIIPEGKKDGKRFRDRLYRGVTRGFSMAKAGYKGATTGAKNGRFNEAITAGRQSAQTDEKIVQDGGTVLGHAFGGGRYQDILAKFKLEIEEKEARIKKNEAQASMSRQVKSGQDSAEDRSKKKIESKEQQIIIKNEADLKALLGNMKIPSNLGIEVKQGETTSQVYSKFEAVANSKRASADAINQELTKAETERALIQANENATEEEKQTIEGKVKQLEELAKQRAQEAVEASDAQARALKELSRYAVTRTLRNDIDVSAGEKEDAVLKTNITTTLQAISNVRENIKANPNSSLVKELQTKLGEDSYKKFIESEEIQDRESLDKIQSILTNYAAILSDENSELKEQIRNRKESEEYQRAETNASQGQK